MKTICLRIALPLLVSLGGSAQAQSIALEPFAGNAFCSGSEPFWSLDYADGEGLWSRYGPDGWQEFTLSGSFGVAGEAHGPLAVWRGTTGGTGGETGRADFVIVAEPAEIEPSESDDFHPTHTAVAVTPDGDLLLGTCALPARIIDW